jgi:hypothetical protein
MFTLGLDQKNYYDLKGRDTLNSEEKTLSMLGALACVTGVKVKKGVDCLILCRI